jgi:hypothetical protein
MGYLHIVVIWHIGKLVCRVTIRFNRDEVIQFGGFKFEVSANFIFPADNFGGFGNLKP